MPVWTHEQWCKRRVHQDPAKRLSDTYNLHRLANGALNTDCVGKWFAARLSDGTGDGVLYDSKLECIVHQKGSEHHYVYVKIAPKSMNVCEADVMLATHRRMYSHGVRMVDPDHRKGGLEMIKRINAEDQLAALRGIAQNLRMPWEAN